VPRLSVFEDFMMWVADLWLMWSSVVMAVAVFVDRTSEEMVCD